MRVWLNWFLILAVVAGGVALAVAAQGWWQQHNAPKYLTVTVSRGRVETVVNSTGTVKPVRTVTVGAFTKGPVKEIYVDFNSEITQKSQVLALIDDRLQRAAVDRDKAGVATQEAELNRIEHQVGLAIFKRDILEKVRKKNSQFISDLEYKEAEFDVKVKEAQLNSAKASIRQAKATLKNSEDQLAYTKILGPKEIEPAKGIKGRVIDRKVDPGQTVNGDFQTPELFTIALEMDKHIHVYASVDEADIGMLRTGKQAGLAYFIGQTLGAQMVAPRAGALAPLMQMLMAAKAAEHPAFGLMVHFTVDAYPRDIFPGFIHDIRLNSTTTQNVVTYPVIVDAPNPEQKLKPGMTANVTFPIESKDDVLRVPAVALRFTPLSAQVRPEDRHYLEAVTNLPNNTTIKRSANEKATLAQNRQRRTIWVQDGDWLKGVPVVLGLMENQFAELISGDLTEGQAIVIGTEGAVAPR